jgi:hypothetical protein
MGQSKMDNLEKLATLGKQTLENTEGAIKNGQSRETGNIGYTRRRKTKQKHNAISEFNSPVYGRSFTSSQNTLN